MGDQAGPHARRRNRRGAWPPVASRCPQAQARAPRRPPPEAGGSRAPARARAAPAGPDRPRAGRARRLLRVRLLPRLGRGQGGRRRSPTAASSASAASPTSRRSRCSRPARVLVLRPMLPAVRPFRAGALCLFAALTLALAAGTLGLGPGDAVRARLLAPRVPRGPRRRRSARRCYWAPPRSSSTSAPTSSRSSCCSPACCSLTGASVAGVVARDRHGRRATTDARACAAQPTAARRIARPRRSAARARRPRAGRRRPTHVEAPPSTRRDASRDADGSGATPRSSTAAERAPEADVGGRRGRAGARRAPASPPRPRTRTPSQADADAAGPAAARRSTEADDFDWQLPEARLPEALDRASRPSPTPPTRSAWRTQLSRRSATSASRRKVIGTVTGPHITRYELRLAPGIKVAKVAQLKDDLAYALAADRHPHPRADPRQAGGRRRGPEPRSAGSSTSATSSRSRRPTGRR